MIWELISDLIYEHPCILFT